ncbi:hypothetical protein N181_30745 [Sinorhizobium fredii USDA 205]|nr:hypothetical protein N181_30745 [Sinorhizobium fredii USDA 205]
MNIHIGVTAPIGAVEQVATKHEQGADNQQNQN